jgi:acetoin utilization deacetylase AcuC-like enzyme
MLKIFYTDIFTFPLPETHPFPIKKYDLLRSRISEELGDQRTDLQVPKPASKDEILRAHDPAYIRRFFNGELTDREIRRIGLPWSEQIVRRTCYSVGATIAACRAALSEKIAVNLGGGTHHAFYNHGRGFCWLNDSAIAGRAMQAEGLAGNILIVDCDVHQGDGTAGIVGSDPRFFTFSIHGKNNFPYHKENSDLDIELDDGTADWAYLDALAKGLTAATQKFTADLVIYLAGADPYKKDRFGRLALTKQGLAKRDRLVFNFLYRHDLPVAVTMAGGYAPVIQDIVDINFNTIKAALEFQGGSAVKKGGSKESATRTATRR